MAPKKSGQEVDQQLAGEEALGQVRGGEQRRDDDQGRPRPEGALQQTLGVAAESGFLGERRGQGGGEQQDREAGDRHALGVWQDVWGPGGDLTEHDPQARRRDNGANARDQRPGERFQGNRLEGEQLATRVGASSRPQPAG